MGREDERESYRERGRKHVQGLCGTKTHWAEILKASVTGTCRVKGSLALEVVQTTQDFAAMTVIFFLSLGGMGSHKSRE